MLVGVRSWAEGLRLFFNTSQDIETWKAFTQHSKCQNSFNVSKNWQWILTKSTVYVKPLAKYSDTDLCKFGTLQISHKHSLVTFYRSCISLFISFDLAFVSGKLPLYSVSKFSSNCYTDWTLILQACLHKLHISLNLGATWDAHEQLCSLTVFFLFVCLHNSDCS